jgi:hypothetical protein
MVCGELEDSVEVVGVLDFGPISGLVPDVWAVFGAARCWVLELV